DAGKKKKAGTTGTIWTAVRSSVSQPFGSRQDIGPPISAPGAQNTSPTVSADGKLLLFNSLRADSTSQNELWLTRRVPKANDLKSEIADLESPTPPAAVAPFDADQARKYQSDWAAHLRTTVETTNSLGAKM